MKIYITVEKQFSLLVVCRITINPTFQAKVSFITCTENLAEIFQCSQSFTKSAETRSTSRQLFARNISLQCSPQSFFFLFLSLRSTLKIHTFSQKPVQSRGKSFLKTPPPFLLVSIIRMIWATLKITYKQCLVHTYIH